MAEPTNSKDTDMTKTALPVLIKTDDATEIPKAEIVGNVETQSPVKIISDTADRDINPKDLNIDGEAYRQRVAALRSNLTERGNNEAILKASVDDRVDRVVRRSLTVESALIALLQEMQISITFTQISVETKEIRTGKLPITATGSYTVEQLMQATVFAQVKYESQLRELQEQRRVAARTLAENTRMGEQATAQAEKIDALNKRPPPPMISDKSILLCYRDRKGRMNYLQRDAQGIYRRTRDINKTIWFGKLREAALVLLEVLNKPLFHAFPNAYRLEFMSVHVMDRPLMELDNDTVQRISEAKGHARSFEQEQKVKKTKTEARRRKKAKLERRIKTDGGKRKRRRGKTKAKTG